MVFKFASRLDEHPRGTTCPQAKHQDLVTLVRQTVLFGLSKRKRKNISRVTKIQEKKRKEPNQKNRQHSWSLPQINARRRIATVRPKPTPHTYPSIEPARQQPLAATATPIQVAVRPCQDGCLKVPENSRGMASARYLLLGAPIANVVLQGLRVRWFVGMGVRNGVDGCYLEEERVRRGDEMRWNGGRDEKM